MHKILQAKLQKYLNRELSDVQGGYRKGRGISDQIANIHWIIEKTKEFQKNIYYTKAFDGVDHNKLWKILKEMGILKHFSLLRNLYASQEATVKTGHGTMDWFRIGKGVCQACMFNFYAKYILWNAGLDESQAESRLPGEISTTSDVQMMPL